MLTSLKLGNFKAFAETQKLPIRPLTLIFGPNSSGKSSLIHGLLLAHHAMETGELDVHRTKIGGNSVDLGGFRQYVHRRNPELKVNWAIEISKSSFTDRINELFPEVESITLGFSIGLGKYDKDLLDIVGKYTPKEVTKAFLEDARKKDDQDKIERIQEKIQKERDFITYEEESIVEGRIHIETFWIDIDGKRLINMSYRTGNYFRLDSLYNEHEAFQQMLHYMIQATTTTNKIDPSDQEAITEILDKLIPEVSFEIKNNFPSKLREEAESKQSHQLSLFPISKGSRKEDLQNAMEFILPKIIQDIVIGLTEITSEEFKRINYLGPIRSYPPRHFAFAQHHDPNWHPGGGFAWDIVRKKSNIRSVVNKWLGDSDKLSTCYELRIKNLLTVNDLEPKYDDLLNKAINKYENEYVNDLIDDLFGELPDRISEIIEQLKVYEPLLSDIQELVLFDKRTKTQVTHRDVGIGISQLLPVLVTAFASTNKIIAIEQPEIHLHPALQAELGDIFIESALGDRENTFLIETHSEHILLRLMRRMRETATGQLEDSSLALRPSDIMVLYVEPDGSRSIVREMPLNEHGDLVKAWPGGFFEEGLREVF